MALALPAARQRAVLVALAQITLPVVVVAAPLRPFPSLVELVVAVAHLAVAVVHLAVVAVLQVAVVALVLPRNLEVVRLTSQ